MGLPRSSTCKRKKVKVLFAQSCIRSVVYSLGHAFARSCIRSVVHSLGHVRLFVTPCTEAFPGSSVHGILQARILEWVAIPFSKRSSWPRDQTQVFCLAGRLFTIWAMRDLQCSRHKRHGFDPWVGKISWRRKCQLTLVFLPVKCHGQRSLVDYSL